jgi:tRNA A37 methylthiotransferase MiaB
VDGKVYFTSPRRKINTGAFVQVKITEAMDYDLVGEVIL